MATAAAAALRERWRSELLVELSQSIEQPEHGNFTGAACDGATP